MPTNTRTHHAMLALSAGMLLLACRGDIEPTAFRWSPPVALSISPKELKLIVGDEQRLLARALDAAGKETSAPFEWSSGNPAIATVGKLTGIVTAISAGTTTLTVTTGTVRATAIVTVRPPDPPVSITISNSTLILIPGDVARFTASAVDSTGRTTSVAFEWTSSNAAVATVGKSDGTVTAISVGTATVTASAGAVRATATVLVEPERVIAQWAVGATASTEWSPDEWSAGQATGAPNVIGCADHPNAWAALAGDGEDWLELTYALPVRPTEIQIHEVYAVGSIAKVEVKDEFGKYQTVYTAQPVGLQACPRVLTIAITGITERVVAVRVSVDQRVIQYWEEIDAVRLSGYRAATGNSNQSRLR